MVVVIIEVVVTKMFHRTVTAVDLVQIVVVHCVAIVVIKWVLVRSDAIRWWRMAAMRQILHANHLHWCVAIGWHHHRDR